MRTKILGFLGLFFVVVLAGTMLLQGFSVSLPRTKFDRIEIGMTRQQVLQLMEETPHGLPLGRALLDTWDFEGEARIWVAFTPDYDVESDTFDMRDPEGENLKVSSVSLLGDEMMIPRILKRFGLRSGSLELSKP